MKKISCKKQYDWKRETSGELRHESSHGETRPPREHGGRYSLSYYSLSHLPRSAFIRIRVRRPKRHNCTRSLAGRRRHAFFFRWTMREYLVAHPDILMLKRPSTLLLEVTWFFTRDRLPTCVCCSVGHSLLLEMSHYYSYHYRAIIYRCVIFIILLFIFNIPSFICRLFKNVSIDAASRR